MRTLGFLLLLVAVPAAAQVDRCACDPARPETMQRRECGLCREAEKHLPGTEVFFLKDINPRKANRWLALPRSHGTSGHLLAGMSAAERTRLWTAAIEKARELFGDGWALALNGDLVRTQCHAHIHIGRLIQGLETENLVVVDGPARIPIPEDGEGMWIHPYGEKLHVHRGEQICESVLLR